MIMHKAGGFFHDLVWLFRFYFKAKPFALIAVLLSDIVIGFSGVFANWLNGYIVNTFSLILNSNDISSILLPLIGIYIGYHSLNIFLSHFNRFNRKQIRVSMRYYPISRLYRALNSKGVEYQENPQNINKITRYKENQWLFTNLVDIFGSFLGIVIELIAALVVTLYFGVPFILISIAIVLPKALINRYFIKKLWEFDKETTDKRRVSFGNAGYLNDPKSLKEIIQIGAYDYFKNIYEDFALWAQDFNTKLQRKWYVMTYFLSLIEIGMGVCVIILLVSRLQLGEIEVGTALFYMTTVFTFLRALSNLLSIVTDLKENMDKLEDAKYILADVNKVSDQNIILDSDSPKSIEFLNVSFKYPGSDKYILKDFNLKINAEEKIAIVGHNGAGKSTLIKLISGVHKPTSGQILIDGIDLSEVTPESWNANLGVLFQDFNMYEHLTLKENIIIGSIGENIDETKVEESLRNADAVGFIEDYPDGMNTILSEKYKGGIRPSTGQWQKIAIARFFYRDAPILILDEPTAAIDAVSEANIFDRIYKFIKKKTVVIISHRFSTVKNADRIIVFENGKIVEDGTHSELLNLDGVYAHAFKLQAKGYVGSE